MVLTEAIPAVYPVGVKDEEWGRSPRHYADAVSKAARHTAADETYLNGSDEGLLLGDSQLTPFLANIGRNASGRRKSERGKSHGGRDSKSATHVET